VTGSTSIAQVVAEANQCTVRMMDYDENAFAQYNLYTLLMSPMVAVLWDRNEFPSRIEISQGRHCAWSS
jgi:hypothetical protein